MAKPKKPTASTTVAILVRFNGAVQFKKALVNKVELTFVGGKARLSVTPHTDHRIDWEVSGFVGTKWSFTLASETEGFAVDPKGLADPGKSFALKKTTEKRGFTFRLKESEEDAS